MRMDTAVYSGYTIPPYYDSMIAKLIVHGKDRREAIAKMISALGEVIVEGIDTNVDYLYRILNEPDYQAGDGRILNICTPTISESGNNRLWNGKNCLKRPDGRKRLLPGPAGEARIRRCRKVS